MRTRNSSKTRFLVLIPALLAAAGFLVFSETKFGQRMLGGVSVRYQQLLHDAFWYGHRGESFSRAPYTAFQEQIRILQEDNKTLRKALNAADASFVTIPKITARILFSTPEPGRRKLWIDRGKDHGVEKGMAVVVYERILLGIVEKAETSRALVMLTTDPFFSATVVIGDDIDAVAQGAGNSLRFSLASITADIQNQMSVRTSGKDGITPRGYFLGRIAYSRETPDTLFLEGRILAASNPDNLDSVFIITQ